jgi:V/A-type H+-transporting ATPase subunit F
MFLACEKERKKYEEKTLPAIIPVPGLKGNNGIGRQRLSDFVERAVGSDIIFNN